MEKVLKKGNARIAAGGFIGYMLFWLTSHPTHSPVRRRIPTKRIRNIEFMPEIKIRRKNREYHVHHWLSISSLYLILLLVKRKKFLRSKLAQGFLIGSILQGLTYKDRFKIRQDITPKRVVEEKN